MTLNHTRTAGLYRHWAPVKDKERPNFIFSSDIPYKISTCVAELHLYLGGFSSRCVDLAKYIETFDITLELNALLLRNNNITPSQLVQNNAIFVAKNKAPCSSNGMKNSISLFPEVWQSILSVQKANETFVVNFCLILDQFSVDLANVTDIRLTFHANDTFAQLLLSDIALTDHLKTYIRQKLLLELKSNSEISLHIADSSTILQDLPPNESISQFKSLYGNPLRLALDFANSSLDSCETSCIIEKQLVFYDDDDFDTSGDEIKILHSDESGKCHSNEDEDLEAESPDVVYQSTPQQLNISALSMSTPTDGLGLDTNEAFDSGIQHLLASPFTESTNKKIKTLAVLEPTEPLNFEHTYSQPQTSSIPQTPPRESRKFEKTPENPKSGVEYPIQDSNPSFEDFCRDIPMHATETQDHVSSPLFSPHKKDQHYSLLRLGDTPLLKKKPSISFIEHDDSHGLKYAFLDSSASVPEYIKENKKFKFIKVGKVQKFVNMFEEHKESSSSSLSRVGTRPGSPATKI